jgi:hypothetical protein
MKRLLLILQSSNLSAGAVVFCLLVIAMLLGQVNFCRWDNMEVFLPAIWYSHSELLHGRFAFWNPFQNLGEPMHAFGNGGALYPPYTIAVLITRLLNLQEAYALDLIAVLHASFGAIGVSKLLSELKVRPALAFAAGVSAMLTGYAFIVGAAWVHVLPNIAWSIWAMWGLWRVIVGGAGTRVGAVMAIVSLTAVSYTGHAQMAANVWLAVVLWALGVALSLGVLRQRLFVFFCIALSAGLLAAPVVLPTALVLPESDRWWSVVSAGPAFPVKSMIGLLLPVIAGSDASVSHHVLLTTFAGAWLLPALLLGIGVVLTRRMQADQTLLRVFIVTAVSALIFLWLSLGPRAGLYSALHALPVFSHMRIPFKYFERAGPLLVLAAALGIELAIRHAPSRAFGWASIAFVAGALAAWVLRPAEEPLAWLAGSAALLTIVAVAVLPPAHAARTLVALVIIQSIGLIGMANSPHQYKPYWVDRDRATRLPINDTIGRVLPLSEGPGAQPLTRPLGRFYSPTLDGYVSATGIRFALTSARLQTYFPAHVSGVPNRRALPLTKALNEHFLREIGVRHVVVANTDPSGQAAVLQAFPSARATATPFAQVFRLPFDPERAWFARLQVPGNAAGIGEALYGPAPRYTVAIPGDEQRRNLPAGLIRQLNWQRDRIDARVWAPAGGLLVFSTSFSREWIVEVDGRRTNLALINGMLAGVWLPVDGELVTLRIRRWPLFVGFAIAAVGLLVGWVALRLTRAVASPLQNI